MNDPNRGFWLTYAGIDLTAKGDVTLNVERPVFGYGEYLTATDTDYWNAFVKNWPRQLPPEGKVRLVVPDGYAEGTAYLSTVSETAGLAGYSMDAVIQPHDDARRIIYPEKEALETAIREREETVIENYNAIKEAAVRRTLEVFGAINGKWILHSIVYGGPDEAPCDNLEEAVSLAAYAIDFNYAKPVSVSCDDVEVLGCDELRIAVSMLWEREG